MRLPSPPHSLATIIQAASDPKMPMSRLGTLVGSDPGFAAQLLSMVNSGLYSRGSKITSVEKAVSMLGSRQLRNVALCAAVKNSVRKDSLGAFVLDEFWENSLRRAVASRMIAEKLSEVSGADTDPNEAFTCGLLQDMGVLALVLNAPELGQGWQAIAGLAPQVRREKEAALFGKSHDMLAAELAAEWRLPEDLAVPLQYHHEPEKAPPEHQRRCLVSELAELLSAVLSCTDKRSALGVARVRLRAELSLDDAAFDAFVDALGQNVAVLAQDLGFRVGEQPSLEAILQAANTSLMEMNLSYEEVIQRLERTLAEKDALAQELNERNAELKRLTLTDPLTGLANRRAAFERLSYEIKRTARGDALSFILGDLDKFKSVNDTYGHDFGDVVLKAAGVAMERAVRDTDIVARVGGEEFVILLPETPLENAVVVANRVLEAIRSVVLTTPQGEPFHFSTSLGVAGLTGPQPASFDVEAVGTRIYRAADAALYRAKTGGRDRAIVCKRPTAWFDEASEAA